MRPPQSRSQNVVETDEEKRCSLFKRLDEERLQEWLKRYSLSDLWEKNVLSEKSRNTTRSLLGCLW
jgi:hypothetical protein